jgi:hypothetical protein
MCTYKLIEEDASFNYCWGKETSTIFGSVQYVTKDKTFSALCFNPFLFCETIWDYWTWRCLNSCPQTCLDNLNLQVKLWFITVNTSIEFTAILTEKKFLQRSDVSRIHLLFFFFFMFRFVRLRYNRKTMVLYMKSRLDDTDRSSGFLAISERWKAKCKQQWSDGSMHWKDYILTACETDTTCSPLK